MPVFTTKHGCFSLTDCPRGRLAPAEVQGPGATPAAQAELPRTGGRCLRDFLHKRSIYPVTFSQGRGTKGKEFF